MLRTDLKFRSFAAALPAFAAAAALAFLLTGPAAAAAAAPEGTPAVPAAPAAGPSTAGQALLESYTAEGLSESVLLRPRAEGSTVRSIEIDSDGGVLVNGKEFDEAELVGFLGEDGKRIAALARLDSGELRAALGLAVPEEEACRRRAAVAARRAGDAAAAPAAAAAAPRRRRSRRPRLGRPLDPRRRGRDRR